MSLAQRITLEIAGDVSDLERSLSEASGAARGFLERANSDLARAQSAIRKQVAEGAASTEQAVAAEIQAIRTKHDAIVAEIERARAAPVHATPEANTAYIQQLAAQVKDVKAPAEQSAKAYVQSLTQAIDRDFAAASAQIKEDIARGLLSPKEAEARGLAAAKAYDEALLGHLATVRANPTTVPSGAGDEAAVLLAGKLKGVTGEGQAAAAALSAVGTAAQTIGGPLGNAAGQVSGLTGLLGSTAGIAAGVGVAFVALGAHAAEMAAEVDTHVRRIVSALDLTSTQAHALRGEIAQFSVDFGRDQTAIVTLMESITANGPGSAAGLRAMTQAAIELSELTGSDANALAAGLDQVIDAFGLSSEAARQYAADLYAVTKGKVPLEDLFAVLARVASQARGAGITVHDLEGAVASLLDAGVAPRHLSAEIEKLATSGDNGRRLLKELAAQAQATGDSLAQFDAKVKDAQESTEEMARRIREHFNASLTDLGTRLLTVINPALDGMLARMDRIRAANPGQLIVAALPIPGLDNLVLPNVRVRAPAVTYEPTDKDPVAQNPAELAARQRVEAITRATKTISEVSKAAVQTYIHELDALAFGATASSSSTIRAEAATLKDALVGELDKAGTALAAKGAALVERQRALRERVASEAASLTPEQGDNFAAKRRSLAEALADPKNQIGKAEADRLLAGFDAAVAAHFTAQSELLSKKLRTYLTDGLDAGVRAAEQKLDEINDLVEASFKAQASGGGPAVTTQQAGDFAAAQAKARAEIEAAKKAAELRESLTKIGTDLESGGGTIQAITKLDALLADAQADVDATTDGTAQHAAALERVKAIQAAIKSIVSGTKLTGDQIEDSTSRVAGHVAAAASAAAGLATAFFGANSEITRTLVGVASVASGIEKISDAAQAAGGFTKLLSTGKGAASVIPALGGIIAGAGAIESALQSFLHKPPSATEIAAQQATVQALGQTVQALHDLAAKIGQLSLNTTAAERASSVRVATNVFRDVPAGTELTSNVLGPLLAKELSAAGISFEQFKEAADAMGVKVTDLAHITATELGAIFEAARSLGIQYAELQSDWEVLGTTATDKMRGFLALLEQVPETPTNKTGAVAKGLEGFDLGTQEGRDAAIAYVREAYREGIITPEIAAEIIKNINAVGDETAAAAQKAAEKISAAFKAIADALDTIDLTQKINGKSLDKDAIRQIFDTYAKGLPEGAREAFSHLFDGIDLDTADGRETAKQKLRAYYNDVLLADGKLDDTERQIAQGVLSIIGDLDDLGTSTTEAAEKFRTAANQKTLTTADELSTFRHDTPTQAFARKATAYGDLTPEFKALSAGLDLTTKEGLAEFTTRLDHLGERLVAGDKTLQLGTLSLDEFTQGALDLEHGVDGVTSAATSATSALDALSGALSAAARDATRLGTDPVKAQANVFGQNATVHGVIGALDLSTEAGRKAALPLLQSAYAAGHDEALGQAIDFILGHPSATAGTAARGSGPVSTSAPGGERTSVSFSGLSGEQGTALVALENAQLLALHDIEALLASMAPGAAPRLQAPAYAPRGNGATTISAPVSVTITNTFGGAPSPADAALIGEQIRREVLRAIQALNTELGGALDLTNLFAGDRTIR